MKNILIWLDARLPILSFWKEHFSEYYVPKNLNWYYVFGFLALLVLCMQLVTGIWLTMFYTPTAEHAFDSIQYIMRDVPYGWLLRYVHSTGAAFIFIVIYLHMFRGLLYGSYQQPRELVWLLGMGLFCLLMLEAFCGYLLPWGQMSYWGAQVMTALLSVVPYFGDTLVTWIRGDYAVSNVTLQRFFALHIIGIPLLILILVWLHLVALHKVGANNPDGIEIKQHCDSGGKPLDGVPLYPHYTIKDSFGAVNFLLIFFAVVFFCPDMGGYFLSKDNFVLASPMVTPDNITPAWYFTPFYSMLRAIPNKSMGVVTAISALGCLFFIPWLDRSPVRSMRYKGKYSRYMLLSGIVSFILLGILGVLEVTPLRQYLARLCIVVYFAYFLLMPWYSGYEKYCVPPERSIDLL